MDKVKQVLVTGNFNILHPGHLRLLKFARDLGDKLIVAVIGDSLGQTDIHVPEQMRLENVSSNIWVDEAFLIHKPVETIIEEIKPDIVVKGKEHENSVNRELEAIENYGGKLIFSSGEAVFSSLDLISKDLSSNKELRLKFPDEFAKRHNFAKNDLKKVIEKFSKLQVCVIGDLIIDEYITCDPLGMSQEDPTIVVTPVDSNKFVGGAGIVAAHASGLGATAKLISVGGNDSALRFANESLEKFGVESHILVDESRPTTLKQRFRAHDKTLLRVSHLHQGAISKKLQNQLYKTITKQINNSDILVFSDYNYGCLPQSLVDRIINFSRKKDIIIAADSQSSSQTGDISRFKGMHFLFPTEHEARISMRNYDDGLVVLSEKLSKAAKAQNIVLKLGSEGVLLYLKDSNSIHNQTDRLKALNNSPKDVAGAGDSMMITTLLSCAVGANSWESLCLGSIASAIQVGRVGNTPLQKDELLINLNTSESLAPL